MQNANDITKLYKIMYVRKSVLTFASKCMQFKAISVIRFYIINKLFTCIVHNILEEYIIMKSKLIS